ncbi:MSHA pilin protein MshB [Ferrimonas marina]|uniref:MSHA pilin protein MshB n=2 Tax=Ferrimonas marina TaxID=299255 RepID=A0A1M5Y1A2_9GAMM|nr:prepilin-type N-terminal cleavage/methylation domain-containing protein [Ferrimonas marina]SHI05568.1 MSHA pilin protein MshB [Ferrimonas marina]
MRHQKGFTFVELVIVVVILGLLAAAALPRFINITDEAERAASEGVGGGFASAVGVTRAQWEVDNRPADEVLLSGVPVAVNAFGYPSGGGAPDGMSEAQCATAFSDILQSAPPTALQGEDASTARYYVTVRSGGGNATTPAGDEITGLSRCVYHAITSLELNANTGVPSPATPNPDSVGTGFIYNSGTGQVISFTN